ncbi:MAG: GreA/GreB family elongation factor [bacterium]|nr:GreA/GreB family elongation factor [bacterium]
MITKRELFEFLLETQKQGTARLALSSAAHGGEPYTDFDGKFIHDHNASALDHKNKREQFDRKQNEPLLTSFELPGALSEVECGSLVHVQYADGDKEKIFILPLNYPEFETAQAIAKVSSKESPIARALIGKKKGESVVLGFAEILILDIR